MAGARLIAVGAAALLALLALAGGAAGAAEVSPGGPSSPPRRRPSGVEPTVRIRSPGRDRRRPLQPRGAPFSGHGACRRDARPAKRCTGNLRVDLPGRRGVPATGARYATALRHGGWQRRGAAKRPRLAAPTLPVWPSTKP